jgi:phage tail tape-measure protein
LLNLSLIIKAFDRASAPLRGVGNAIDNVASRSRNAGRTMAAWVNGSGIERMRTRINGVATAWDNVSRRAGQMAIRVGAALGIAGYAFKTQFLDTASKFERFQTILETLEGSAEGAKRAMDWVSEFAVKTPYELDEVMDSFVKLRAYGMDPTLGLLATLGDTSAAMGKQLVTAVEAIADAVTGENERLKEFGIKARQVGSQIVYEYSQNGKTMTAVAQKNSREQIQAVLEAIFNEKYAGAMLKLSKTGEGLWSNLMDLKTRFTKDVMDRGPYEALKARLEDVLNRVTVMGKDGRLDRIAQSWADAFLRIFDSVDRLIFGYELLGAKGKALQVPGLVQTLPRRLEEIEARMKPVVDLFGGWGNFLAAAAGAILFGPLLAAIGSLIAAMTMLGVASSGTLMKLALWSFGPAIAAIGNFVTALRAGYGVVAAFNLVLAANPIGAVVVAIAALAAGAYLIYQNWEPISAFFSDFWEGLKTAFLDGWAFIKPYVDKIGAVLKWTPVGIALTAAQTAGSYLSGAGTEGGGAPKVAPAGTGPVQAEIGGRLEIHVTADGRTETKATSKNPNLDLPVTSGLAMGGAR